MIRRYSTEALTGSSHNLSSLPVLAGLLLSRTPLITPEPSAFEKAYYHYQDELERRLMWTFPVFFYFKRGSMAERRFNTSQRGPAHKQPGVWFPRGDPDILFNRDRRLKQQIIIPKAETGSDSLLSDESENEDSMSRPIRPNSRTTEFEDDAHKLARKLDRTLYLITKTNGSWKFPSYKLNDREPLHVAAERGLRENGGVNINTWTVSNTPALFIKNGENKEFFIKSHVLHGKFVPQQEEIQDFAWLTKNELEEKLPSDYYQQFEPVLNNQ